MDGDKPDEPDADGSGRTGLSSQELCRKVNEHASTVSVEHEPEVVLDVFCECTGGCLERLHVSQAGYEAVRRFPIRFLMKKGHVANAAERIVEMHKGHVVVEKVGPAAAAALRHDPRRQATLPDGK